MAVKPAKAERARRSTQNTEIRIIDEACRLFAESGFDGTSIRDIAGAVGISNAALYHYFPDKNALFGRIFISVTQDLYAFVESRVVGTRGSASERLRAFMRGYACYFQEYASQCIAASLSFRALEDSKYRKEAIYWRDKYESLLRGILREGVTSGEFRENNEAMTGRAILSCLNWLHRWYTPKGKMTPIEIVDSYADIFVEGIISEQARASASYKSAAASGKAAE